MNSSKLVIIFQSKDKELDINHGGDEEEEEEEEEDEVRLLYSQQSDDTIVFGGWKRMNFHRGGVVGSHFNFRQSCRDYALVITKTSSQEEPMWTRVSELTVSRCYVLWKN